MAKSLLCLAAILMYYFVLFPLALVSGVLFAMGLGEGLRNIGSMSSLAHWGTLFALGLVCASALWGMARLGEWIEKIG